MISISRIHRSLSLSAYFFIALWSLFPEPADFFRLVTAIADNPKAAEMVRANLKPGQVFSFKNFKITSPSGVWDNVPGISYLVVE